jgi:hypothetical protein
MKVLVIVYTGIVALLLLVGCHWYSSYEKPHVRLNGRNVPYFFINPKSKNGHHWWTILKHGTP